MNEPGHAVSDPHGAQVTITGSAGTIGSTLLRGLPPLGWRCRGFDRVAHEGGVVGDICASADLDAAMGGADAVVHMAGQPTEAAWPVVREANIEGTFQVFDAARRAGVRRVVWASSNHAAGFTPLRDGIADDTLPDDTPPRPDTLYGVSKAFGEALAAHYAERYGMDVVSLRIGSFGTRPTTHRALWTWLSPGDAVRLVDACLRGPAPGHTIVWGVSANSRGHWSRAGARAVGYQPLDDAETYADELPAPLPSDELVGGPFTTEEYDR